MTNIKTWKASTNIFTHSTRKVDWEYRLNVQYNCQYTIENTLVAFILEQQQPQQQQKSSRESPARIHTSIQSTIRHQSCANHSLYRASSNRYSHTRTRSHATRSVLKVCTYNYTGIHIHEHTHKVNGGLICENARFNWISLNDLCRVAHKKSHRKSRDKDIFPKSKAKCVITRNKSKWWKREKTERNSEWEHFVFGW